MLAHAPKALHDEVKANYTDMMYAEDVLKEAQGDPGQVAAQVLGCG